MGTVSTLVGPLPGTNPATQNAPAHMPRSTAAIAEMVQAPDDGTPPVEAAGLLALQQQCVDTYEDHLAQAIAAQRESLDRVERHSEDDESEPQDKGYTASERHEEAQADEQRDEQPQPAPDANELSHAAVAGYDDEPPAETHISVLG